VEAEAAAAQSFARSLAQAAAARGFAAVSRTRGEESEEGLVEELETVVEEVETTVEAGKAAAGVVVVGGEAPLERVVVAAEVRTVCSSSIL
jgi:pyruvate-formate lyase-activating enzyme